MRSIARQSKFRTPVLMVDYTYYAVDGISICIDGLKPDAVYNYYRLNNEPSVMTDMEGNEYMYTGMLGWSMCKPTSDPYTQQELFDVDV